MVCDGNIKAKQNKTETQNYLFYKDLLWKFLFKKIWSLNWIHFLKIYHYFQIQEKIIYTYRW